MKKIEKIRNREAARVLCIEAYSMLERAKDKMAEIEWNDQLENMWQNVKNTVWDFHVQNCDKDYLGK